MVFSRHVPYTNLPTQGTSTRISPPHCARLRPQLCALDEPVTTATSRTAAQRQGLNTDGDAALARALYRCGFAHLVSSAARCSCGRQRHQPRRTHLHTHAVHQQKGRRHAARADRRCTYRAGSLGAWGSAPRETARTSATGGHGASPDGAGAPWGRSGCDMDDAPCEEASVIRAQHRCAQRYRRRGGRRHGRRTPPSARRGDRLSGRTVESAEPSPTRPWTTPRRHVLQSKWAALSVSTWKRTLRWVVGNVCAVQRDTGSTSGWTLTCAALRVRGCDVHAHACLLAPPPTTIPRRRQRRIGAPLCRPRHPLRRAGCISHAERGATHRVPRAQTTRLSCKRSVGAARDRPSTYHGNSPHLGEAMDAPPYETCEAPSSSASSPCSIYSIPESSGAGGRCWAGDWEKGGLMMMTGEHTSVLLYVRRLTLPMLGARQAQCTSGRFLGCARGCALHPVRAVCVSRVARFRASALDSHLRRCPVCPFSLGLTSLVLIYAQSAENS